MAKKKKPAARRRSVAKATKGRRRSTRGKSVQMASGSALIGLVAGAAIGNALKDNAAIAKLLPNPRTRYMVMGGAGLVLGTGLLGKGLPAALRPAFLGMGAAMVPAILPTLPLLGNGAPTTMGRISADQMAQLRGFVAKQRAVHEGRYHGGGSCDIDIFKNGMRGRDSVITGRSSIITGRRAVGVITGRRYGAGWR